MRTDAHDAADAEPSTRPSIFRRAAFAALLGLFALPGCIEQVYKDSIAEFATMSGGSSTTDEGSSTPTTEGEVQTATGSEGSTSASTDDRNEPPKIELFDVVPEHLDEAGPAELRLIASEDVVTVHLSLDSKLLKDFTLADFPRLWEALSAKDNGEMRKFEVVVEDAEGLTDSAEATLSVLLPQSGAEKCIFKDPEKGTVTSVVSAVKFTTMGIYGMGTRDSGAGLRLTLWKLDPNTCEPLPGWPKTMENWSDDEALVNLFSLGSAVDVDEDENIVVAGNLLVDNKLQSYVALLNSSGSLIWEHAGEVGDEVNGVAAAIGRHKGRVFVVGSRRTSDVPVLTDAATWIYRLDNGSLVVPQPIILKAPFVPGEEIDLNNQRSESLRAVVIQPDTGDAIAVGEREFKEGINKPFDRAFAIRVQPLGAVVGAPQTSQAPALKHDALRSVAVCGHEFLAGGWTRDDVDPNATPEPLIRWIGADGTFGQHRHLAELTSTQLNGTACDRELKLIGAGTTSAGESDTRVFSIQDSRAPLIWYDKGAPGDDGANSVACDPRGFCAWGGSRTNNGKLFAVVRVHHP